MNWTTKPGIDKSPQSPQLGILSAGQKSYKDMSHLYNDLSSSSDGSVGENLDKLKQLFSGSKNQIKALKMAGPSPPREKLALVKGKTT